MRLTNLPHKPALQGGFVSAQVIEFKQKRKFGRGERIRTSGPCLPKTVLYQAELLPDRIGPRLREAAGAKQGAPYRWGLRHTQAGNSGKSGLGRISAAKRASRVRIAP